MIIKNDIRIDLIIAGHDGTELLVQTAGKLAAFGLREILVTELDKSKDYDDDRRAAIVWLENEIAFLKGEK